jgi:fumarylacetoacetase
MSYASRVRNNELTQKTNQPVPRIGTIIGDHVLDVKLLAQNGAVGKNDQSPGLVSALSDQTLNAFAAQPRSVRADTRTHIIDLLSDASSVLFADEGINSRAFIDVKQAKMHLPMQIGAFADFMCSETHHDNVRSSFLPSLSYFLMGHHTRNRNESTY